MHFLLNPIGVFAQLKKRPAISDALFIVASIWIVLLGLQFSRLAGADALTATLVLRSVAVITFGIAVVWFSVAGLGNLLAIAAGGKSDYAVVVAMTALAATPFALFGIAAICIEMIGVVAGGSSDVMLWTTRTLLLLGLFIGAPGLYFALGIHAIAKIRLLTSALMATFFSLLVVLGWLVFRGDVLQF